MKDLYSYIHESILDIPDNDDMLDNMSDQAAIIDWINKYMRKDNPHAEFVINKDGTISNKKPNTGLKIVFKGFDELPEFIKFKGDPKMSVTIIVKNQLKSFRGVPTVGQNVSVHGIFMNNIPAWDITAHKYFGMHCDTYSKNSKPIQGLNINMPQGGRLKLQLPGETLDGVTITGKNIELDFVNDFNFGDKLSRLLSRKAPMNKYRNVYEDPVTDEGYDVLENFFKGVVDLRNVFKIGYTQASCLMKYNGVWYRCKNW